MRTIGLILVSAIIAVVMTTSTSHAGPSCCDPAKSANGAGVFSLSPLTLKSAPMAPAQLNNTQPRPQRPRAAAPQAIWNGPAAAPGYVTTNQVVPASAPGVPACCAQAAPGNVTRQSGCCGQVAPNPVLQQGACCGQARANATAPRQGCCPAVAPKGVPRQGGCCAQTQACPGCTGQQLRGAPGFPPAPGNCCPPAPSSSWSVPGVTSLPAGMPIVNGAGYTGPTRAGQAVRMTGANVSRPMNSTVNLPTPAPSYSLNQQRSLW